MRNRLSGAGVLGAAGVAGLLFAPVFTAGVLAMPIAAVVVAVLVVDQAAVGRASAGWWRPPAAIVTALVALAVVTARTGEALTAETVRVAATEGWSRTLASTWPVRDDPALSLFVPLLVLLAAVVGIELLRGGAALAALLPALAVAGLAQALEATSGRTALLAGVGLCVAAALTLSGGAAPRGRGSWPAAALGVVLVLVAAGVAWRTGPDAADARSLHDEQRAETEAGAAVNPLDEIADRLADPRTVVFRNRTAAPVERWPLVVLDDHDGQTWTGARSFRPLGARLGPQDGNGSRAEVRIGALRGPWLPTPGRVTAVTAGRDLLVDERTGTVAATGTVAGLRYDVAWSAPRVTPEALITARASTEPVTPPPGLPDAFTALARDAAEAGGSPFGTALALERRMRDDFRVATGDSLPTGHGYAQLDYFLGTSKRGTSEQFAGAYVLLARSAGLRARLVVGFRQPAAPDPDGLYTVRNADVLAWPEVHLDGPGWVPLDPTAKADTASRAKGGLAAAVDQARQVPRPDPSRPPGPDTEDPPPVAAPPPVTGQPQGLPAWPLTAVAAVLLLIAVPGAVPLAKTARARRRRRGGTADAVAGAVAETRDRLRDHGIPVPRGATLREIAARQPVLDDEGRRALETIAGCADRALWSGTGEQPATAAHAWQAVGVVRRTLRRRPLRSRLRAAVHPGTLRRR